jgi:hypothetical protein
VEGVIVKNYRFVFGKVSQSAHKHTVEIDPRCESHSLPLTHSIMFKLRRSNLSTKGKPIVGLLSRVYSPNSLWPGENQRPGH